MELRFIEVNDSRYPDELEVRYRVLREPLGMPRSAVTFAFEGDCLHLVALEGERVLGCVLFHPESSGSGRLLQMAVWPELHGQGVGRQLVRHLERSLTERGFHHVHLHARAHVVGFYEKLGYRCVGAEYLEVGIPHRNMERELP